MDVLEPKTDPVPRHIAKEQMHFYRLGTVSVNLLTYRTLTPEEAGQAVADWRARHTSIADWWRSLGGRVETRGGEPPLPQPPEGGQGR